MKKTLVLFLAFVALFFGMSVIGSAEATTFNHCIARPGASGAACYTNHASAIKALRGAYVLGTDYRDTKYRGPELIWYGSHKCINGKPYKAAHMPSGWNDRVSSSKRGSVASNCNYREVYSNSSYRGVSTAYTGNKSTYTHSSIDTLSDKISSEKFGLVYIIVIHK